MIFISRYTRLRVGLRPTVRQLVHGGSASQETLIYKGITVEFEDACFDSSKKWQDYCRPEAPEQYNPVKTEEDLIRMLKASPFYGSDFFERADESPDDKKKRLLAEIAQLEAAEKAENPDPTEPVRDVGVINEETPKVSPVKKAAAKAPAKKKSTKKASRVDL